MRSRLASFYLSLALLLASFSAAAQDNPVVVMNTSMGTIRIELYESEAPDTVANFLRYTEAEFFDGLIFHRVISGFMIQGGGFSPDMVQKPGYDPIKNEAKAELPNDRGTIAMARTNVPDSATSQFFINLVDNSNLNFRDPTPRGIGYAVFGRVVEGMEVVDAIAQVQTGAVRGYRDVPVEAVVINSVRRVD